MNYGTLCDYTITHQLSKLLQIFDNWDSNLQTRIAQVKFKNAYQSYYEIYEKYPKDLHHLFLWYCPDERKPVVPQPPIAVPKPTSADPRVKVVNSRQTGMGETQVNPKRKRRNRNKKNKNDESQDPKSKNQSAGLQGRELEDLLKKQLSNNKSVKKI